MFDYSSTKLLLTLSIKPWACVIYAFQHGVLSGYNSTITAIHTVKPENIATFLGRKLHGCYQGDMGNNFNIRIEGSRIKHRMGSAAIKMYDKHGLILRIETTVNEVSRIIKRLHLHGLIKKVRNTYKYYLTKLGRIVIATGLKLKELFIIPQLCSPFSQS